MIFIISFPLYKKERKKGPFQATLDSLFKMILSYFMAVPWSDCTLYQARIMRYKTYSNDKLFFSDAVWNVLFTECYIAGPMDWWDGLKCNSPWINLNPLKNGTFPSKMKGVLYNGDNNVISAFYAHEHTHEYISYVFIFMYNVHIYNITSNIYCS